MSQQFKGDLKTQPHKNLCMDIHGNIIHNSPNRKHLDAHQQAKWGGYMTKYYSAINRNECNTYATTWMNPINTMLSESTQSQSLLIL